MGSISETFILHRRMASGASCALNLTHPCGITLLNSFEATALDSLLCADGRLLNLPSVHDNPPVHSVARQLGILSYESIPTVATGKVPKTLTVWVHTSSGCNLSCSYCYIPQLRKALTPERATSFLMPEQVSSAMVSGMVEVCKREGFERLNLKFAGGEPTLNWAEVVRTCNEAKRACEAAGLLCTSRMLTNGVFNPAEVVPDAVALNMKISISVDGNPEAHDEKRFVTPQVFEIFNTNDESSNMRPAKRRGSWSIIAANVDRLLDAGIRPYLLCTVDQYNYKELKQFVEYCANKKLGFRLSPVRDTNTYKLPGIQDAMTRELISLYQRMGEEHPIDLPIPSYGRFAEWDFQRRKRLTCGSCRAMLAVGESGRVASCQMRLDRPVASLQDEGFAQVFDILRQSDEYTYFIHPEKKTGGCATCNFRHTCAGGCPEHARMVFGSNNHVSPWCDLYTALLPEYVSAIGRQMERIEAVTRLEGSTAATSMYSASLSAQWYSDPSGRHEYRYWNGTSWTDDVANKGRTETDPLKDPRNASGNSLDHAIGSRFHETMA